MSGKATQRVFLWLLCVSILLVSVVSFHSKKQEVPPPKDLVITAPEVKVITQLPKVQLIGHSVEERAIESYTFGNGPTHIIFIGGIHGGYEWNSTLLAYEIIDHLTKNPSLVPANLTVDILPSVNPDALYKVTGKVGKFSIDDVTHDKKILIASRMNVNNVDLNRNFDCMWQPKSTWQSKIVSAGSGPFSEPETITIKDFILRRQPAAVIFWHSKANGVYASQCKHGILSETKSLMNSYAQASGYSAISTFDAYPVTGAAEDWLASINIPAITVELSSHETIELDKNIAGTEEVIKRYTK